MVAIGLGSLGVVYRTWRTDKEEIKGYIKIAKDTAIEYGHKIKDRIEEIFGHHKPPVAGNSTEQASGSSSEQPAGNTVAQPPESPQPPDKETEHSPDNPQPAFAKVEHSPDSPQPGV